MLPITVVVPCYNSSATIRDLLTGLQNQDHPNYQTIVVDDASTDGTAEIVRKFFPSVRIIVNSRNRGPAYARNQGILHADNGLIVFVDSDCMVEDPTFLAKHAKAHERPEVSVVAGGVEGVGDGAVAWAHKYCYWFGNIPYSHRVTYGNGDVKGSPWGRFGKFFYSHSQTANLSAKKVVFSEIGFFDEELRTGEDVDFCERVLQKGMRIDFNGDIVVKHRDRATLRSCLSRLYEIGLDRVRIRRRRKYRFWWVLPSGKISAVLGCFPLSVVLTLQVVGAWLPYDWRVVLYLPLIFLDRLAMTVGIAASFFSPSLRPSEGSSPR